MLDWNDLRYFLAVHRERTLSGAGRALKVDQTTVGRRIAAMEAALGARLFNRATRGFTLTSAGDAILPDAERIEQSMLTLTRAVAAEDARLEGLVRIATNEAFANHLLIPSLPALHLQHPGIRVEVLSDTRFLDLERGEADIAVRARRAERENLVVKKLGVSLFGLYASADYLRGAGTPQTIKDLDGHTLVAYTDALGHLAATRWLDELARPEQVLLRCNTLIGGLAAAVAGLGLAVLPCHLGGGEPHLRRVGGPATVASTDIWMVVHPAAQRIARVRAVTRHVTEVFRSNAGELRGQGNGVQG